MLPIHTLEGIAPDFDAHVVDLISRMVDFTTGVRYRLEECIVELRTNIKQHSETPIPGLMQAQAYMTSGRVRVVLADMGIGIKQHLGRKYADLLTMPTPEVLEHAMESGV